MGLSDLENEIKKFVSLQVENLGHDVSEETADSTMALLAKSKVEYALFRTMDGNAVLVPKTGDMLCAALCSTLFIAGAEVVGADIQFGVEWEDGEEEP